MIKCVKKLLFVIEFIPVRARHQHLKICHFYFGSRRFNRKSIFKNINYTLYARGLRKKILISCREYGFDLAKVEYNFLFLS